MRPWIGWWGNSWPSIPSLVLTSSQVLAAHIIKLATTCQMVGSGPMVPSSWSSIGGMVGRSNRWGSHWPS